METTILGRTGLKVSVVGLGCGGPSRLGLRGDPQSSKRAIALVRQALDLGVNFVDTAESYGTEAIVGKAIAQTRRDQLVISTKKTLPAPGDGDPEREIKKGLEQSLKFLGTDYVDIYHLHGVEPGDYEFAKHKLMPVMRNLKEQGKVRFVGVTEAFVQDPSHQMLCQSLGENLWDVVMVGFNVLNPSARNTIFPLTAKRRIGVLGMFAVRRGLSRPDRLREIVAELIRTGALDEKTINPHDPLDFVLRDSDAHTIPEAAYRFCRHEPGVDVVLTGTGNPEHLKDNLEAILKPPLPQKLREKLATLFGQLEHLTGN